MQVQERTQVDPAAKLGLGMPFIIPFNHHFAEIEEAAATGLFLSEYMVPDTFSAIRGGTVLRAVSASAFITSHHASDFSGSLTAYLKLNGTIIATWVSATLTVSGATNASPIVVTTGAHSLVTGDTVQLKSVGGNTNANGMQTVTVISSTTFSLNGVAGNSNYTSGGVARKCRFETDLRTNSQGIKIIAGDKFRLDLLSTGTPENFTGIQVALVCEAFGVKG